MRSFLQLLIAILLAFFCWRHFVGTATRELGADLEVFLAASQRVHSGQDIYMHVYDQDIAARIYGERIPEGTWFNMHYLYPPFLAVLIEPLAAFNHDDSSFYFAVLNYVCLLITAFILSLMTAGSIIGSYSLINRFIFFLLLTAMSDSFYVSFAEGQVNIIVLMFIVLSVWMWLHKRDFPAGALLSVPALLKVSPALLLAGPLRQRRWLIAAAFFITAASAFLLLLLSHIPTAAYSNFFSQFSKTIGTGIQEGQFNLGVHKLMMLLPGAGDSESLRVCLKIFLVLPFIAGLLAMKPGSPLYPVYSTSLLIIGTLIASPITWSHHLVLTILPLTSMLMREEKDAGERIKRGVVFLGFAVLFAKVYSLQAVALQQLPSLLPWIHGGVNIALVVLAVLLVIDGRKLEAPESIP